MRPSSFDVPTPRPKALPAPAWLTGRRRLFLGTSILAAGAVAVSWPWLVSVGAAPLLISAAPCLVMCTLGLCMTGGSRRSCSTTLPHGPGGNTTVGKDSDDA